MAINSVSGKMIRQKDKIDHDNRLLGMVTSGKGSLKVEIFGHGWLRMVMGGLVMGCYWVVSSKKRGDREGGRCSIF